MNYKFQNTTFLCIFMAASIISMGPQAMAIEKPSHKVMATEGNFELRKYSSYIVAETYVEGDFEAVGSEGLSTFGGLHWWKKQKKGIHLNDCTRQPEAGIRKDCHDCPSQPNTGKWSVANSIHDAIRLYDGDAASS
jgi:hypothetical protein